jgi:hypothetical protein
MKKLLLFSTSLSLFLMLAGTVSAQTNDRSVNLIIGGSQAKINGKSVTMSAPAQVVGGSTMVPLRFISEAFGCDVQWDSHLSTATVTLVDQIIEAPVGQNYAVINGEKTEVQVPAQLINGSTYVPLRFISENLGAKVDYNTNTRAIAIAMKTYVNKEQDFEMVLPTNWIVDKETTEGVEMSAHGTLYSQVGLADKGDGIDTSNFNTFAEECFKEYETKEVLNQFVNGLSAVVLYKEDGLVNIHAYKVLDEGIYFCVFAIPEESIDAELAAQCDIVINSLKSAAIK